MNRPGFVGKKEAASIKHTLDFNWIPFFILPKPFNGHQTKRDSNIDATTKCILIYRQLDELAIQKQLFHSENDF